MPSALDRARELHSSGQEEKLHQMYRHLTKVNTGHMLDIERHERDIRDATKSIGKNELVLNWINGATGPVSREVAPGSEHLTGASIEPTPAVDDLPL